MAAGRQLINILPDAIETVINPSRALDRFQRLNVYANAYLSRLLDCMRNSFPALTAAIGEEAFDAFSFGYLQTYPSLSYTLNELSSRFIQYREETRPKTAGSSEADWSDFVIDLATLGSVFEVVFAGPGIEELPPGTDWASGLDEASWSSARLEIVPCLHLLDFRFPVNDYYMRWRKSGDSSPAIPAASDTYLAVTRREYVVRRFELERCEFQLLRHLADGESVGVAIERVAESVDDLEVFSASLGAWFERWTKRGFFHGLISR